MNKNLLFSLFLTFTFSIYSFQDFLPCKVSRSFHAEQERRLQQLQFDQTLDSLEKRPNPYALKALNEIMRNRLADTSPIFVADGRRARRCAIPSGDKFAYALEAVPETLEKIRPAELFPTNHNNLLRDQVLKHAPAKINTIIRSFKNRRKNKTTNHTLLIHGNCGTGKTLMPESIAHALGIPCFLYCGFDISNEYQDSGEVNLVRIFEHAALNAPCVLSIDGIESILNYEYPHPDAAMYPRLCALLKAYKDRPILFIGTSINKEAFPTKLTQLCKSIVKLPMPNNEQREQTFNFHINKFKIREKYDFSHISVSELAKLTEGFSYREISDICDEAVSIAWYRDHKKIILCMHDFYETIDDIDDTSERIFKQKPRPKNKPNFLSQLFLKNDKTKCVCRFDKGKDTK